MFNAEVGNGVQHIYARLQCRSLIVVQRLLVATRFSPY